MPVRSTLRSTTRQPERNTSPAVLPTVWLEWQPTAFVLDIANNSATIRSKDPSKSFTGTFDDAVQQKGFVDLTDDYQASIADYPDYTGEAFTIYHEGDTPSTTGVRLWSFSDGTTSNRSYFTSRTTAATEPNVVTRSGGSTVMSNATSNDLLNSPHKAFYAMAENNGEGVCAGIPIGSTPIDTSCAMPIGCDRLIARRRFDGHASTNRNANDVDLVALVPYRMSSEKMIEHSQ